MKCDMQANRIYHGNCLEVMKEIKDKSVDMVLCDLPYGMTNAKWDTVIPFEALWEQYRRVIKQNGAVVLTGMEPFSSALRLSNPKWYRYDWTWDKVTPTGFLNAKKQPLRVTETISVFYQKQPVYHPQMTHNHERKAAVKRRTAYKGCELYNNHATDNSYNSTDRYPINLISISTDKQRLHLHPTQKPVALFEYLIRTYSNEGDLILDNCIGSGTTAVAAINTRRRFIGIEIDEMFVRIAIERAEEARRISGEITEDWQEEKLREETE